MEHKNAEGTRDRVVLSALHQHAWRGSWHEGASWLAVLGFNSCWTAGDATSHLGEPSAVRKTRNFALWTFLSHSGRSPDNCTALGWLRCLLASTAVHCKVKQYMVDSEVWCECSISNLLICLLFHKWIDYRCWGGLFILTWMHAWYGIVWILMHHSRWFSLVAISFHFTLFFEQATWKSCNPSMTFL